MEHRLISPAFNGDGTTFLHPLSLVILVVVAFLIFFRQRTKIIAPMISAMMLVPVSQGIVIGGLDLNFVRIVILMGWIRVIIRKECDPVKLNAIDKTLILWVVARTVSYFLLWQASGALVNRLGYAFDAIGIYFLMRYLIQDFEDIQRVIHALVFVCVLMAIPMVVEYATGYNLFRVFSGFQESALMREGRIRSQGPFQQTILAGTFGATQIPLFIGLWWFGRRNKRIAFIGVVAATIITFVSISSGPFLAYLSGIVALCMWRFRGYMRVIRWGIVFLLLVLHVIMEDPVWALIMRVGIVGGSSRWHRYQLIDQFIRRFDEWWFTGTKFTDHWGHISFDVSNWYVRIGIDGGIITLALFFYLIIVCFRSIGFSIAVLREHQSQQLFLWAIGSALFAHVVSFMGVSYWDQIVVIWYTLLAIVSSMKGFITIGPSEQPLK